MTRISTAFGIVSLALGLGACAAELRPSAPSAVRSPVPALAQGAASLKSAHSELAATDAEQAVDLEPVTDEESVTGPSVQRRDRLSAKRGPENEKPSPAEREPTPEPEPAFPVGEPVTIDVPGDHPVLVFHAPPEVHRAVVYLHGLCGDPAKIESWAPTASAYGTIIALTGNRSCGRGSGRFKWGFSLSLLNRRILAAVDRVAAERGGLLDTSTIALIGYSQGAVRAEQMPRHYPSRYTHVVLAGGPTAPQPWLLSPTRAVVIVGGEHDRTRHLRRGLRNLLSSGQLAAYMELPEARHGEFGPDGAEVMGTALWWLFDRAP